MIATFRSTCPSCGNHVHPGDEIKKRPGQRNYGHTRCPDNEHVVQPHQLDAARAHGVDGAHVQYLAEILVECNDSEDAAWVEVCQHNEHWDGETEIRDAARRKFDATLPLARAQNILLHRA